jgi:hypothetical protein
MLLLLEHGELAGTAVHARWHEGSQRLERRTRLILAFAVSLSFQGRELSSGQRASDAIVAATLADIVDRDPPPVVVAAESTKRTRALEPFLTAMGSVSLLTPTLKVIS